MTVLINYDVPGDRRLERARSTLADLRLELNEEKTWRGTFLAGFRYLGTEFVGSYAFPALPVRLASGETVMTSGYEGDSPEVREGWRVPYGVGWV